MSPIITRNNASVEQNWLKDLANGISEPSQLLSILGIDGSTAINALKIKSPFPLKVPMSFVERMEYGNPFDPLLRQILPLEQESEIHAGYSSDPLGEQDNTQPSLLHKYKNRVLLILKGGCAVNCRYCFRRHFPYQDNKGTKSIWQNSIHYIAAHPELNEVILSGGDPLMAKDHELKWLLEKIETIPHIKRIRIHSRLPVVIPSRITEELCQLLKQSRLQTILVTHINHANEINTELIQKMSDLTQSGVTLLNQSVLLKGVNDNASALITLSERLFDAGILPYYLHVLDKVQGAAHFFVSDDKAKILMLEMSENYKNLMNCCKYTR